MTSVRHLEQRNMKVGGPKKGSIINLSKNLKAVSDEEIDPEIGVTFECGS